MTDPDSIVVDPDETLCVSLPRSVPLAPDANVHPGLCAYCRDEIWVLQGEHADTKHICPACACFLMEGTGIACEIKGTSDNQMLSIAQVAEWIRRHRRPKVGQA